MTVLRYAGFKEEDSFAPDSPPPAQFHVDKTGSSLDTPGEPHLIYGGGLGRAAKVHRPGFYSPSGNIVYASDINTIAYFLKWALGGYKFNLEGGTNGLNEHKIYGAKDVFLPSFCAGLGKDHFEHVFSGCVINTLQLEVEGEFAVLTAEVLAAKDSKDDIKKIEDLSLPKAYLLAFHNVTVVIGDENGNVVESDDVKSLTLDINNNSDAEAGRALGSRYSKRIRSNEREVTANMNLNYTNTDVIEKFWGSESGPADTGTKEIDVEIALESGEHGSGVITLPKCILMGVNTQPSGRDELVQEINVRALMDTEEVDGEDTETDIVATIENNESEISS